VVSSPPLLHGCPVGTRPCPLSGPVSPFFLLTAGDFTYPPPFQPPGRFRSLSNCGRMIGEDAENGRDPSVLY